MINFDFASLRLIGLNPASANQLHLLASQFPDAATLQIGRITEIHRNRLVLDDGQNVFSAQLLPLLSRQLEQQDHNVAVGDWGLWRGSADQGYYLIALMPALNRLVRRQSASELQVLASNIDSALLVMGLDHDFNLQRLERYLALVSDASVTPLVLLTKADLCDDVDTKLAMVQQRLPAEIPVFAINGKSTAVSDLLSPWLGAGQTLILLGSSGAGKSTLSNTLTQSQQKTGSVRLHDSRGHHTTTARSLHRCPDGACIIDSPGLRGLQLNLSASALNAGFADIDNLAQDCQFRDCRHLNEPGCAVRAGVDHARLKNYQKLQRESQRLESSPLDKIAKRAKWKVLVRSLKQKQKSRDTF